MRPRLLASLALLPLVLAASVHAELAGSATVTDGDTLTVAGQRIRLFGMDAPENAQSCREGESPRIVRYAGDPSACRQIVAVCFQDWQDVKAWLIHQGRLMFYRPYSTVYIHEETAPRRFPCTATACVFSYDAA